MKVKLVTVTEDAEQIIEDAGRTCYQSGGNGKVGELISKLVKSGHHSVLEHAYATFRIEEVSRALTHQLVRHRLASFSQQSQRFVKESQFDYVIPPEVKNLGEEMMFQYRKNMAEIQDMYDFWKQAGLKNEDARFVLPNACHTEIVMSANFREFRHIFEMRCDKHAQWEIRYLAMKMLGILYGKAPNVFGDQMNQYYDKGWVKDMDAVI